MSGVLTLVATPIGNLADITARAVEALSNATIVCCEDTRRSGLLLQHLGISGKKYLVVNEHTEHGAVEEIVSELLDGSNVVLITDAGTPGISDPGERVVRAVIDAGLSVTSTPGPAAVIMALVVSGLPTNRFVFEGFIPRGGAERTERPDEQRLADPFRTPIPATDLSIAGRSRWTIVTARAAVSLVNAKAFTIEPFAEVARAHVSETLRPSGFDPRQFYGSDRIWSVSLGAKLALGMSHMRMGRYGVAIPQKPDSKMGGMKMEDM